MNNKCGKNIWITIVDDWELRGNGTGNVIDLQLNNSVKLMQLFKKLGIKSTFNVEVMQQLAFDNYADKYENIREQRDSWIKAVKIMQDNDFDIQLHIHPQWYNATFDGNSWRLNDRWNIVDYTSDLIERFVDESIDYLNSEFNVNPVSFRGGAWGVCCPSRPLFEILEKRGIRVDISIVNGLYSDTRYIKIDYTNIESPYVPYFPDYDDVRTVSDTRTKIIEISTQSILRDWKYLCGKALKKIFSGKEAISKKDIIENKVNLIDIENGESNHFSVEQKDVENSDERINKKCIIMDITSLDSYALQLGFDIIIKRALKVSSKGIFPLVVESHTKDLSDGKLKNIEKAVEYIIKKYEKYVKFATMKEIVMNVDMVQPVIIKKRKELEEY